MREQPTASSSRGRRVLGPALPGFISRRKVNWVADSDILKFFHAVSQDWLIRFMEHRIGNRRMIRLIATWLEAGVRPHRSLGKKPPVVFAKKAA